MFILQRLPPPGQCTDYIYFPVIFWQGAKSPGERGAPRGGVQLLCSGIGQLKADGKIGAFHLGVKLGVAGVAVAAGGEQCQCHDTGQQSGRKTLDLFHARRRSSMAGVLFLPLFCNDIAQHKAIGAILVFNGGNVGLFDLCKPILRSKDEPHHLVHLSVRT